MYAPRWRGGVKALLEKGYARTTARDIVALSGTNLASIGYHYGSTEALMTAAMLSAMEDWGDTVGRALGGPGAGDDPMLDFWRRVIRSIQTDRALWLASIEVLTAEDVVAGIRALGALLPATPPTA
ncbi:TetR/AcrR family transcriptional regulator [Actinoplanes siamensis]|uniref:HTH tetR-type domain-containing protein n=1 Tax=Actinoplanes siamensis TaxID=1223317 RepID=A0A919N361_9ACTN|nr:TetR/AcrR family transcriptional regulator [Actinoplanes siamensis]GIF03527.1 hypothetical protein Asi03nite_10650 [Actinoplanes siamensis]